MQFTLDNKVIQLSQKEDRINVVGPSINQESNLN